ncbi:esterase [Amycolatopsis balhimycina DSM 5908]|uniref:Esterase n=1 Tax=Amycolatopsis balhimycina DSM 5908 TaxID=1081091 RepID=A0A428WRV2_AMYBA|nr:alpha/beta hydrolase-fold protein [Amycolatopsis balhimycina]RSM45780.1 esterase [Amycolatopsis balhimycina DSM 5908]
MSYPVPAEVAGQARAAGPLESPWLWLTFAALAVACVVGTILVRRRKGARRCGIALAVVFVLLATTAGANAGVGYVRSGTDLVLLLQRGGGPLRDLGKLFEDEGSTPGTRQIRLGGAGGPAVERMVIADPGNGVPGGRNFVLLPPGYTDAANANRRYPVVYLVHGNPGGPEDWLTAGDAPGTLQRFSRLRALPPMIVVSVDLTAGHPGRDWEGLDVPGGPKLESYLAGSVVPAIDRRYRTVADRGHRALGGMSGGAFAALNIGLHRLDAFGALLLAMPYDVPDNRRRLSEDPALLAANTPRDYLSRMSFPQPVAAILTAGSEAPGDVTTARSIADALRVRGQQAAVRTEEGFGHTWRTARASLPYLLAFAAGVFARPRG